MSDESKPRLPEMASGTFEAPSFDGVLEAIHARDAQLTDRAFQLGFRMGWEEAYKKVKEAFSRNNIPETFDLIPPTVKMGGSTVVLKDMSGNQIRSHHTGKRPIGTKEIVKNFIALAPGLRGVELVSKLNERGFDLQDRTVRTALHRLKSSDELRVVDGRWYTPESAPPDPLSRKPKEDDMPPPPS